MVLKITVVTEVVIMTSFSKKNTLAPWQPTNSQGSFSQLLRCFCPKGKKSLGRSPRQELEVGPRSGPYLLVTITIITITMPCYYPVPPPRRPLTRLASWSWVTRSSAYRGTSSSTGAACKNRLYRSLLSLLVGVRIHSFYECKYLFKALYCILLWLSPGLTLPRGSGEWCWRRFVTWRDGTWRDVTWRDVTWRDVTWRDVTWLDVTWRDVTSRHATSHQPHHITSRNITSHHTTTHHTTTHHTT